MRLREAADAVPTRPGLSCRPRNSSLPDGAKNALAGKPKAAVLHQAPKQPGGAGFVVLARANLDVPHRVAERRWAISSLPTMAKMRVPAAVLFQFPRKRGEREAVKAMPKGQGPFASPLNLPRSSERVNTARA